MGRELAVLILEDSENDALLLIRKLNKEGGYATCHARVDSLLTLRAELDRREWDIIISDHSMPQFSAVRALQEIKERGLDIPVIILSGTIEPGAAVAAMKAGAADYIMKNDTTRLLPAIERELREAQSRREKRLAESELIQAQKMESIGRLAGGVAHDFNNILTVIMGCANFLTGGPTPGGTWREDVAEIRKAAERAAALTRQLLAFSRRQAFQLMVVDLNAEFADLEGMIRRMLGEDIEWVVRLAPGLGTIKADPGQIQQAVMNLVVNARDAMPRGGRLTVLTENAEFAEPRAENGFTVPPGSYVAISVSDTGVGVEPRVRPHLFEPFFTTKEKGKGTGLGLAMIYGVVKQSGGFIAVDSVVGQGATFKLYFPRVTGTVGARAAEPASRKATAGTEAVLLVDDDEAVRVMVGRVLRRQGYAVLEAARGEQALDLARTRTGELHLLLTDMVLPDINGIELARRLADLRPETKLLLISGYLDRGFGDYTLPERIPFLQKPFTTEALVEMVREVLDSGDRPDC